MRKLVKVFVILFALGTISCWYEYGRINKIGKGEYAVEVVKHSFFNFTPMHIANCKVSGDDAIECKIGEGSMTGMGPVSD